MSSVIARIAAEAERLPMAGVEGAAAELRSRRRGRREETLAGLAEQLPAHQFPGRSSGKTAEAAGKAGEAAPAAKATAEEAPAETALDPEEERQRRIYRRRTVALLRRYMRYSIETGRLPSLMGKEFFRAKVTAYTVLTFEDRVIFVHDMEKCLEKLDQLAQQVLMRVVLQEYEHEEAARLLGCTRMTVHRKLLEALDALRGVLLQVGLLEPLESMEKNFCQEGKTGVFSLSDCEEEK